MIEIDPTRPEPLYQQIAERFRRLIALGALAEGDRLPTVRDLAVQLRVNRNTAARAIRELEAQGVVRTRVGRGTFVEPGASALDRGRIDAIVDALLDHLVVEARTLGLPFEELPRRLVRKIEAFQRTRDDGDVSSGAGESDS